MYVYDSQKHRGGLNGPLLSWDEWSAAWYPGASQPSLASDYPKHRLGGQSERWVDTLRAVVILSSGAYEDPLE